MDETLRVKIVAETSQATSSMKQLNKETQGLGGNTNAASAAVDKLDKALNSLGFRSIKIKAVSDSFKSIRNTLDSTIQKAQQSTAKFSEMYNILHRFKNINPFQASKNYLEKMSKISGEAVNKIKALRSALPESGIAAVESGDFSGLAGIRQKIEELANSRNKVITKTFNEEDFSGMKSALLNASKAAAKGSADEYKQSMLQIHGIINKATEKLTFKTVFSELKKNIKEIGQSVLTTIGKIVKTIGKVGLIGGAVTGLVAAIALVKNALDVSKLGDDIDKTSQKVGMSTDAFQKWAYVLERCGIEASQLKTSMRALTRNSMGNNASYFKQLGIDPSGLSQQQLFDSTVKALQNISDSTERARMAYKLFGQSSAELAPLLAISSAEVQRLSYQYDLLGATMSGKVVRASADLQDAITDMKSAFQGLKNTLAQAILPLVTKIVVRITVLIAKINMILQALFGVEYEYNDVAESTETVTKNTNDTVKAVKKLKTLISGFDELNIFPSQDNGAELGGMLDDLADYGSDVAPVIGNILPPEAIAELENFRDNILPGIVEKINKLKDAWEKIKESFSEGDFGEIFKILGETFDSPFLTGLGDAVQWVIDRVKELEHWLGDVDLFGWELPDSFQEFLGLTEDWHIDWDNLLGLEFDFENSPLGRLVNDIGEWDIWKASWWSEKWENFKKNIDPKYWWSGNDGEVIGLKQMLGFDKIEGWDIWKKEWWQNLFKKGPEDGTNVGVASLTGSIEESWNKIKQWWNQNVSSKFTTTFWQGKFQTAAIGLSGVNIPAKVMAVWTSITTWWNTNVKPKFTTAYWQTKFNTIKSGIGSVPLLQGAKDKWNSIKSWWDTNIAPKFTSNYWKTKWNTIRDGLGYASILTSIKEKWVSVKSWWDTNVAPKFTWTYWRDKFNSIKTGLSNVSLVQAGKNIINGLINTIETGINRLIDKINGSGVLNALKKIGVDVTLNRIYIPRLAKGGIIDSPTIAQMGEYPGAKSNPEIVTPENKMREVFENSNEDVVSVLVQGFRQIIQAIEEKDTSVQIGDTTIAKSAARGNKQYRLQTGQSLF